ncbi:glycosyltransferase [Planomonospora sp. ID67723]|uniref:dolichyl-phosphate beta-glucosyltransferase n=1 Tax=Planomonospora sp. ID67723 TaxID=2738134 RepID=UPI0018C3A6B1|nr:dolichyl-phosphate beta-glucosyltransferase [Planomonospora sp. ID67723]MBG0831045.1 glycosyltransferase [Planomonospora sp. ID67723]
MSQSTAPVRTRLVEIVVPVHNEQRVLAESVRRLHAYLTATFPYGFRITIADNASADGTWPIAVDLSRELPHVRAVHLDAKGRGRALRRVWSGSDADVVGYMDVDLSTDLDAFLPLVAPLLSGHSDLAIGTRLSRSANVVRGPKRELISRSYNLLLRGAMGAGFSDAQCGFKAARAEIAQALLPGVEDEEWFFDTELLLLAERHGLRIHEVPVDWVDDPDSRVDIVKTIKDDLRGMTRVARRTLSAPVGIPVPPRVRDARLPAGMVRQLPRFAVIGAVSTLAHLGLFVALRAVAPAVAANALALLITAIANTAANRRFTFGVTGRAGALRHQLQGGLAFLVGLLLSTGGLALLKLLLPGAPAAAEVAAVIAANALATLVRFLLLRGWVFTPRRAGEAAR